MYGTKTLFAGLVLSVVAGSAISAEARQATACTPRTDAISHLATKYEERPVAMGLSNSGGVIEILTNKAGTTWSILVTMPDGTACMLAAGEHWEKVNPLETGAKL